VGTELALGVVGGAEVVLVVEGPVPKRSSHLSASDAVTEDPSDPRSRGTGRCTCMSAMTEDLLPATRVRGRGCRWLWILLTISRTHRFALPGASGAQLELIVGGYLLASATLFITGARLGQARGYRRISLAGVVAFGLASLACGLAPSPVFLIVARVVQGAGGALLIPQILTGIQLNLDGEPRARALGLYATALAAGAVAGQILAYRATRHQTT
jgi:Major Facilitator Superfamily